MINSKNFDVIIAGAGIAGLLLASELSKTRKVLLIEANKEIQTNKFWVTLKSCADLNPHLLPYLDNSFQTMDFSDAYRNKFTLYGDYVLWDTVSLVNYFKQEILKNEGVIKFEQRFCGYKTNDSSINIFANDACYNAKLFIDCMGYGSPLVLSKDLIKFHGHYVLYGAKLKLKESINPICLSNVILDKHPKYLEVFPTSQGEAYVTMIYPTKGIPDLKVLTGDFRYIISKSIYSRYFENDSAISKLWGIVPIGDIKKKSLNRILFFGESAQSNPAATGTCLTRLFLNYIEISTFINSKLDSDDMSRESLSEYPSCLNPFVRKLQLHAYNDIVSWNSDKYSKFINIINHVDHTLINKFIFGDLQMKDLITMNHFKKLIKPKNFFLAKPLIDTLFK